MINTQHNVGVIYDDLKNKDSISPEQRTKVNNFLEKIM